MNKKAAILCAEGIGDGLLMMISACQMQKKGYDVTIFTNAKKELQALFPGYSFVSYPSISDLLDTLLPYDLILLENDNSARAWHLFALRESGKLPGLHCLFPTSCRAIRKDDILFNKRFPVASNIASAVQFLLKLDTPSKENDLEFPKDKTHRLFEKRIVFHPTSKDPKRNWKPKQFVSLAKKLKKEGYTIAFAVSPEERKDWLFITQKGLLLPEFSDFKELAAYIYESGYLIGNDSGLGHLASNLNVPTLTISGNLKRLKLWRPDWIYGEIATPLLPLPDFKGIGLRIRQKYWQYFVSKRKVWRKFQNLAAHGK